MRGARLVSVLTAQSTWRTLIYMLFLGDQLHVILWSQLIIWLTFQAVPIGINLYIVLSYFGSFGILIYTNLLFRMESRNANLMSTRWITIGLFMTNTTSQWIGQRLSYTDLDLKRRRRNPCPRRRSRRCLIRVSKV